jgi:hypothetical protein
MKKILILFAALLIGFAVNAQDKTVSWGGLVGIDNATTVVKDAAYNYVFKNDIIAPIYYTYQLRLVDSTGSNTATAVLSGSLDNAYWKTITSVSYTGAGSDTTIIGNLTSAPITYKYLRWTITPSDSIWVDHILMNIIPTVK